MYQLFCLQYQFRKEHYKLSVSVFTYREHKTERNDVMTLRQIASYHLCRRHEHDERLLPPASEGRGKVIFSVCLSVHTRGGGGLPHPADGGLVPHPADGGGGVPHPADGGGVPHPADGGGYPSAGGHPPSGGAPAWGTPPSRGAPAQGTPPYRSRWGVPWGTPPP